jgi:hypothetical protein
MPLDGGRGVGRHPATRLIGEGQLALGLWISSFRGRSELVDRARVALRSSSFVALRTAVIRSGLARTSEHNQAQQRNRDSA